MKTLIIFSSFEDLPSYYLVTGNYSHLNQIVINTTGDTERQHELNELLFDSNGTIRHTALTNDDLLEVIANHSMDLSGLCLINVGMVP